MAETLNWSWETISMSVSNTPKCEHLRFSHKFTIHQNPKCEVFWISCRLLVAELAHKGFWVLTKRKKESSIFRWTWRKNKMKSVENHSWFNTESHIPFNSTSTKNFCKVEGLVLNKNFFQKIKTMNFKKKKTRDPWKGMFEAGRIGNQI